MYLSDAFGYFDPFLEQALPGQLGGVHRRALALLHSQRNIEQLKYAILAFDWMLNVDHPNLPTDASAFRQQIGADLYPSPTKRLHALIPYFVLDTDEFPDAEWHEFFGVLSLGLVSQTLGELPSTSSFSEREHPADFYDGVFGLPPEGVEIFTSKTCGNVVNAMEAVCLAEALQGTINERTKNELVEQQVRDRISLQNSKAARQRLPGQRPVIERLFEFWEYGRFPSMLECVRRFEETLSEKDRKPFRSRNMERTLYDNLRKHVNNSTKNN